MPSRVPWARGARFYEEGEGRTYSSTDELDMSGGGREDEDPGYSQPDKGDNRHGETHTFDEDSPFNTKSYTTSDYLEGEEEFYDEVELSEEQIEDAFKEFLEVMAEAGEDIGDDFDAQVAARRSPAFQSYLQARARQEGRRAAGLESRAARERAAQLSREARGEGGPDAIQRELSETIEKLRQAQTSMARSRRGRSGAAAQLGAQQTQGQLQAQGVAFDADYSKRKQVQSGQALEDFLLQRAIAGEEAGALDMSRQAANDQANRNRSRQFLTGLVQLAGNLGSMLITSDEKKKSNKRPVGNASREMLDKLETKKYDRGAKKDIYGGMAQSLKASKMGKGVVTESADGTQMLDVERAVGMMLTTLKDQHKRIKQLEAKKGK